MKVSLTGSGVAGLAAVAIGGFLLYIVWKKGGAALGSAVEAVNPTNPDNLAAGTVNRIGRAVSGEDAWSLGSWLYDLTHDDGALTAPPPYKSTSPAGNGRVYRPAPEGYIGIPWGELEWMKSSDYRSFFPL